MAIAGVGSFSESLTGGLAREGRTILGGDVAFSLIHREASAQRARISGKSRPGLGRRHHARNGARRRRTQSLWSRSRRSTKPIRCSARCVLDPGMPLEAALAERDGVFGALAEPALLARLDLQSGRAHHGRPAHISKSAPRSVTEPDKLAGGIGFGPRLLISENALRATGLVQPGSLVRWHYRAEAARQRRNRQRRDALVVRDAETQLPDAGWEIRTRANASPQLERNIERFTQFLTLVGLTALIVGGVGVANAVKGHLDRKRDTIAAMKSLGATGGRVFAIYLAQVLLLAAVGSVHRSRARRGFAVRHHLSLRQRAFRCRSSRPCSRCELALALALRTAHRARLRAVAARPRA